MYICKKSLNHYMEKTIPRVLIIDVDGVLSTGQFIYSIKGKEMKIFGPDDNDALSLLKPYLKIIFVTGDKKGYKISEKRIVKDMKYKLELVSTIKRIDWITKKFNPKQVIYIGDGIFDHYVFKKVLYSISTNNADENAKKNADFVTKRKGGERAVAEACLHILKKFFKPYNPNKLPHNTNKISGQWTV
jgi:3-deoxy-D-manno-octulosonate 8-phosphate phosphatase (KDO 8-P phosphatase)